MSALGATLSATFEGVPSSAGPSAIIRYGKASNSLNATVNCTLQGSGFGSFSAVVAGLDSKTSYYYQAVMTLANGTSIQGDIKSFTTNEFGTIIPRAYLDGYEMPETAVNAYGRGTETFGSTRFHVFKTPNSNQRIVTHTFAHDNSTKRNYSFLYDTSKKCALWVAFAMNSGSYPWKVDRSDDWKADPALPTSWQPDLSSAYPEQKRSALYSRGHQVASNDRRTTTEQTKQTTYYSNMTPQLDGFNGGVWATLEGDIQKIGNACSGSDTLYVVTGPIFDSGYITTVDKNDVVCAVPTRYFKCIMKVSFSNGSPVSATGAAYLLVHQNSGAERQNVSINDIESITGFDFFANVPTNLQNTAEAETHPTSYFPQKAISTSE